MPKLSDLLVEKAKADVQVGAATVHFTFYVMWKERFTDEEWAHVLETREPREQAKLVLPRLVLDWDVVDDDEHAIPVNADAFDAYQVPTALLLALQTRALGSELSGKAISRPLSGA